MGTHSDSRASKESWNSLARTLEPIRKQDRRDVYGPQERRPPPLLSNPEFRGTSFMHIVNQSSVRRTLTTPIYSENTTDHGYFENIEFQRLFFLRLFLIRGPKKNPRSQWFSARAKVLNTQDLNDKTSDGVARLKTLRTASILDGSGSSFHHWLGSPGTPIPE